MGTAFSNRIKITMDFLNNHLSKLEHRDLYSPVVNTKRCTPLIDLLPSNVDTIDYLSLDTEGSELAILKTIPFGKLKINVISVDVSSITGERRDEGLYDFLWKHGYRKAASLTHDDIFYLSSW